MLKFLRTFLASIIGIIFCVVALVGVMIIAVTNTYLNPDFYQGDQFEDLFYDLIVEEISYRLLNESEQLGALLSTDDIREEVEIVIPPELISETMADVIAQMKQVPLPDILVVDAEPIKNNLPLVVDSLVAKISPNLPVEIPADLFTTEIQDEMMIDYIPPKIELPLGDLPPKARRSLTLIFQGADHVTESVFVALSFLLVIIGLIIWKPFKLILRMIGGPILVAGILLFQASIISNPELAEVYDLGTILIEPIGTYIIPWMWGFLFVGSILSISSFVLPQDFFVNTKEV
jgi:hypothetical protein